MKNITIDGVEYMPVPKSELVNQDYEILSFRNSSNSIYSLKKDGNYHVEHIAALHLSCCLRNVKNGFMSIESVKRLSDGELFTVKDGINYEGQNHLWEGFKEYCSIEKFSLKEGDIFINEHYINADPVRNIKDWVLYVKPTILLTTEDKVDITNGEHELFICDTNFFKGIMSAKNIPDSLSGAVFSTEGARDEYILMNKPVTVTLKEFVENKAHIATFFKSKQK